MKWTEVHDKVCKIVKSNRVILDGSEDIMRLTLDIKSEEDIIDEIRDLGFVLVWKRDGQYVFNEKVDDVDFVDTRTNTSELFRICKNIHKHKSMIREKWREYLKTGDEEILKAMDLNEQYLQSLRIREKKLGGEI